MTGLITQRLVLRIFMTALWLAFSVRSIANVLIPETLTLQTSKSESSRENDTAPVAARFDIAISEIAGNLGAIPEWELPLVRGNRWGSIIREYDGYNATASPYDGTRADGWKLATKKTLIHEAQPTTDTAVIRARRGITHVRLCRQNIPICLWNSLTSVLRVIRRLAQ